MSTTTKSRIFAVRIVWVVFCEYFFIPYFKFPISNKFYYSFHRFFLFIIDFNRKLSCFYNDKLVFREPWSFPFVFRVQAAFDS